MESPTDYWDLTPGVELRIFPAPASGYRGAFNPKGVAHAWRLLTEPLTKLKLGRTSLARLAKITVEHEPGPATDTRAQGNRILVAHGHVRGVIVRVCIHEAGRRSSPRRLLQALVRSVSRRARRG